MTKVYIECEEDSPSLCTVATHTDSPQWFNVAEVPNETLVHWMRVQNEMKVVQSEMWDAYVAETTKHNTFCLCWRCSQ